MKTCIVAAENEWGFAGFSKDVLKRQCDCAMAKNYRETPVNQSNWKKSGTNSAIFALVQCARSDLIGFYEKHELAGEMRRLKKMGLEKDALAVKRAKKFSVCVGEISYREILQASAIANLKSAHLDENSYLKMYRLCEAKLN